LKALGHVFKTLSDTEIILHGWESWGTECLSRFRGMFAFALWDRNTRKIFMARDRLGVKPFYYALLESGELLFGSELKALTAHPKLPKRINDQAVADYLALGYVPDPKTIYQAAFKLPPAHFALIDLRGPVRSINPQRYWQAPFGSEERMDHAEALEELQSLVNESVKLRMISEVPLGAFLSGGVDSSLVVASMSKASTSPVVTCSIGFDVAGFDETQYSRAVAEQFKTDHSEFTVSGDDSQLFYELNRLYDEPFADASAIPTYRVCQLARKRVTVALSGDGADETFAGYRRYRLHLAEEKVRGLVPHAFRRPVFGALGAIYPRMARAPQWLRAKSTLLGLSRDSVEAYFHSVAISPEYIRRDLVSSAFTKRLAGYTALNVFREAAKGGPDDQIALAQHIDYQTYLAGDINVKVDRASMAHSLEVREPLMDHKLVEWSAKLHRSMHLHTGQTKSLLKDLARKEISSDIVDRPKQGFIVPIAKWMRGELGERLQQIGSDSQVASFVNLDYLGKLFNEHLNGQADHSRTLWSVAVLDAFLAMH
jgi:asparagine synthase (glutamine-hydrolysing)